MQRVAAAAWLAVMAFAYTGGLHPLTSKNGLWRPNTVREQLLKS